MPEPKITDDFAEAGKGTTLKSVEVFSVGQWRGSREVKADNAFLDSIVASFRDLNSKVAGFGVPIKLGHNDRIGEPAFGWMTDLVNIDGKLVADFADVDPAIVDAISKRRYNSVSVELYPVVKYAGQVFNNVLGGVALLGAEWPAVKGLKPLSASVFASSAEEKIELSIKEPDMTFTEDQHATLMAAAVTKAIAETEAKSATALADAAAALAAAVAAKDAAEAKSAEFAEAAEKTEIAEIIKVAESKGQIVPANKAAVEAFAEKVRTAATGEARKALLATFKGFVEAMPAKVKFGEQGKSENEERLGSEGDKAADQIDAKVKAHMAANKSDYSTSFAAILADPANAELKTAYAQEM